jgi:hypothetical protein
MQPPREASLVEQPFALRPRPIDALRDMALVTQANLVTLRVQQCRRSGIEAARHDIRTPAPGVIRRMREHLLDRHRVAQMPEHDLALRCRQVWGEFSAFCWLFHYDDPNHPPAFADVAESQARCGMEIAGQFEHCRQTLWRIRFEQQLRFVPSFRLRPDFHDLRTAASHLEADVYGHPAHTAPPEALVLYACETAGVMAGLRWAMDDRWGWEQHGISDVGLESTG